MQAADVMTTRLVTVAPGTPVVDAIDLMLKAGISGLPVVTVDNELLGIVTEGDFLRRAETETERQRPRWLEFLLGAGRLADSYVHAHARFIDDVMTRDVATVGPETPVEEVVALMEKRKVKRIPVLRDGKLAGLVSRADILRQLAHSLAAKPAPLGNDAAISACILAEIAKQPWVGAFAPRVTVKNGEVEFAGVILHDEQRAALRVLAESVPGVTRVVDRLALVDPMTGIVFGPQGDLSGTQD